MNPGTISLDPTKLLKGGLVLKTLHDLINFHIALNIKHKNWSKKERSEKVQWALEIYLGKSIPKRKIDEPSSNHIVEMQSSDSEESQSGSSDYDSYNLYCKDNSYNE